MGPGFTTSSPEPEDDSPLVFARPRTDDLAEALGRLALIEGTAGLTEVSIHVGDFGFTFTDALAEGDWRLTEVYEV